VIALSAAVALVLASLAMAAGAFGQSSAGDNQYQDPFGSGGSSSHHSSKGSGSGSAVHHSASGSGSSSSSGSGSLTQAPPASSSVAPSSSAGTSSATGSGAATSTAAPRTLPRTGFDVWELALLGAGLLACGVGLRLRTVDVRRF
jgi:hypothetical protein